MLLALACLALSPQQTPDAAIRTVPPPQAERPGLGQPVAGLHPHWRLESIDLGGRNFMILDLDCLEDSSLLFQAIDMAVPFPDWKVSLFRVDSGSHRMLPIATDLQGASHLCAAGDSIYVVGMSEVERLQDLDGDGVWEHRTAISSGWATSNGLPSARGLVRKDGLLFTPIVALFSNMPWPSRTFDSNAMSGSILSIDPASGSKYVWMSGFVSPLGLGVRGKEDLLVVDSPHLGGKANYLYDAQPGRFAGNYLPTKSFDTNSPTLKGDQQITTYGGRVTQGPALCLPTEVSIHPDCILWSAHSPIGSDIFLGDSWSGALNRVILERVSGVLQGVLLRHSHKLPSVPSRFAMAPDGSMYLAALGKSKGASGSWQVHRLTFDPEGYEPFEIESVKVQRDGFLLRFSKPLDTAWLKNPTGVRVLSWALRPSPTHQDVREHALSTASIQFGDSPEALKIQIADLEPGRVYHIQCDAKSPWSDTLWSGEAWYTVNRIPGAVDLPNIGLGALPPADATPLIGTSASTLMDYQGREGDLPVYEQEDFVNGPGYLEVGHGGGNLISRTTHGDAHVHVEWYCPPGGEGDTRSNSGVYLHGRYEVQVFGTPVDVEPRVGGAGAIYGQHAPSRNMSTGPGTWQAYDIFFSAPRFEDGEKTRDARISMFWNGVRVHGEAVVSSPTGGAQGEEAPTGPLLLQDYRDGAEGPVRFRNVWIRDWKAPKWQPGEWQTPFEDPSNWMVRGGKAHFELKDGVLRGTTRPNTPNTFFTSRQEYDDFELLFEARVHPELNSGVQIRSELVGDRNAPLRGYQVEIDPSPRSWTAGLYEERGRGWLHPLNTQPYAREAFRPGQWNQFRVLAEGPRIRTWLNGIPVADVYDAERTTGHLGFQVHGVGERADPLEVAWRNLKLRTLRKGVE